MKHATLSMGHSTRKVAALLPGLHGRDFFFSYGRSIPDLRNLERLSFWFGGAYAVKLQSVGLAGGLCSPGPEWLADLDPNLLSRAITSGTVSQMEAREQPYWVKPAEAKVTAFPAGVYRHSEIVHIFEENNFMDNIQLQWTDDILAVDFEHRFFVADGSVVTGSVYKAHDVVWGGEIDSTRLSEAAEYAQAALDALKGNTPPAFTLDVALNMKTNEWFIVEANRAWSSGFYGADPYLALEVVDYSCEYTGDKWKWHPDEHLIKLSEDWEPLTIEPVDSESIEFFKYQAPLT